MTFILTCGQFCLSKTFTVDCLNTTLLGVICIYKITCEEFLKCLLLFVLVYLLDRVELRLCGVW